MSRINVGTIRRRLGLSIDDMAKALGVNTVTINRWETGAVVPQGIAQEVLRGIEQSLADGADGGRIAGRLRLGVAAVIYHQLSGTVATETAR